ncbi:MAG: hypothetical protein HDT14_05565 [Oscillibacter sp.]|nr:hypothetical protein [Oscillibacter sp.]
MDEQELIRVDLRLPASALDNLARLAEQLRRLTAAIGGLSRPAGIPEEMAESGAFDPERFRELRQKAEKNAAQASRAEAQPVRAGAFQHIPTPESAGNATPSNPEEPERAQASASTEIHPQTQAAQALFEHLAEGEIPAAHPAAEEFLPSAPSVRIEPDSQIPDAEAAWEQAKTEETPLSSARAEVAGDVNDTPYERAEKLLSAQAEITGDMGAPQGVGAAVTARPEIPQSRWTGITEELTVPGPAPLTAEAVSQAFQRDGRRYDNGFPLY